jgi:uncharacterized protein YbjQ (UPF0145 family)
MPFFHHNPDEERQRAEREASLESLVQGGIPLPAQRRLDDIRHRERFFTSDFTVNEFLLARQCGLQPLTQVTGSSVYHVGWQDRRLPVYGYSGEVEVVSEAMNDAAQLALGRLAEEAQRAGADAVVGVHLTRRGYDWAKSMIEFSLVGTAVRYIESPPSKKPSLTNLSGQDVWKLIRAGYVPRGLVVAGTLYWVVGNAQAIRARSRWTRQPNVELTDFTQGLNAARHIVMNALRHDGKRLGGAAGVVGTQIEHTIETHYDEDYHLLITFHAIGTAIAGPARHAVAPPVSPVMRLRP